RRERIGAHQDQASSVALRPERLDCRVASRSAADDDDPGWKVSISRRSNRSGKLARHEQRLVAPFHRETGHRVEGRGGWLAGSKVEARVVEGTENGVSDDNTLGERATIVRTDRTDGQDLGSPANQQDGFTCGVSEEGLVVAEAGFRHALFKVGTFQFDRTTHGFSFARLSTCVVSCERGETISSRQRRQDNATRGRASDCQKRRLALDARGGRAPLPVDERDPDVYRNRQGRKLDVILGL